MTTIRIPWFACMFLLTMCAAFARAADVPLLRAYPDPVPDDVTFDTVVKSQSLPFMKYPVNALGTKVHPEEFHLTSSGELILPYTHDWRGLCVAPLVGVRTANAENAKTVLSLPPADGVTSSLVEGYMPAVENRWKVGDIEISELAFATEGGKFESTTGREALIALVRYMLKNTSSSAAEVEFALQFGEAHNALSVKTIPSVYPHRLSFESNYIRQEDGAAIARLLTKDEKASFEPIVESQSDPAKSIILNEKEENIASPEYKVQIEREGDKVTVATWQAPSGMDLYIESARIHSSPLAVDVEIVDAQGVTKLVVKLSRTGFSSDDRSLTDYIAPGQASAPLPWAELVKAIPQGKSTLVLRCYYPVGAERKLVSSWSPIVILAHPDVFPRFKNVFAHNTDKNRLHFKKSLAAGQSKSIEIAVPYFPLPKQNQGPLDSLRFDEEFAGFQKYWSKELNRNADFTVPESRIRNAYRACLASNMILTDRDPKSGVLMPHPDPVGYEAVWAGDGSVSIQAMDRLGYHQEAESMLDYFLSRQGTDKPEGDVSSAEGFFSGDVDLKWMNQDGFVLWAMAEHYKLTHNDQWLRRVAPQLVKGCDWIIRERTRTKTMENGQKVKHYGLLPKGRPSDLYIWDNWYWTDTYSYMGLRGTADVLAAIGMKKDAERLAAEADDYKACILDSIKRSIDPQIKPPFLPPSPYRVGPPSFDFYNEYWYTISGPLYMVEAGLLDAKDERVSGTCYWIEKCGLYSGLPAFTAGAIDPYYVYNQSLTQLLRGEQSKFAWTLYSLTSYAMSQGTYATIEGQNIVTGFNSDVWCASRQPHMHSNSRFLDMVRIALLLEDGETLHLLAGAPREWLADGQTIEVKRAPSYFGEVNFTAHSQAAQGKISIDIEPPQWQAPKVVLHVRPPTRYGKIQSVQVNGKDWNEFSEESVDIPRLEKKAHILCTFSTSKSLDSSPPER